MDAESIQETLKMFNFRTTYAILVELTINIYPNKSLIWENLVV